MKKGNKIFIIIMLILIISLAIILFIYFNKDNKIIKSIFNHQEPIEEEIGFNDSYNGVYKYKNDLGRTYNIFKGCSISSLDQYIIVINKEYYVYDSTCMGTFYKGSGKVENLNIKENNQTNKYYIDYDGHIYQSDTSAQEFTSINKSERKINNDFDFNSFNVLMKNTQRPGGYYRINTKVANLEENYLFNVEPIGAGYFDIIFKKKQGQILYQKNQVSLDNLPEFKTYTTNSIIVLEKDSSYNKYSNRLIVASDNGIIYNSDNLFPINIQNVELNTNNSIFIKYDSKISKYRVLIGYDDKFCRLEDQSEDIVNYEFTISYDYNSRTFTNLEFVKIGRAKDGCNHVNSILEENK